MAAFAARSLRCLARSSGCISKSSLLTVRKTTTLTLTAKGTSSTSISLLLGRNDRSCTRAITLIQRRTYDRKFCPTIVASCVPKVSPLAVECAGESSDCVEGNLGDDDGDTWSLDDDESYLKGS